MNYLLTMVKHDVKFYFEFIYHCYKLMFDKLLLFGMLIWVWFLLANVNSSLEEHLNLNCPTLGLARRMNWINVSRLTKIYWMNMNLELCIKRISSWKKNILINDWLKKYINSAEKTTEWTTVINILWPLASLHNCWF